MITALDEKEKKYVNDVIKEPIADLQTGAFLHMLD